MSGPDDHRAAPPVAEHPPDSLLRHEDERPCLEYEGFDPREQGLREALCALGNGYLVTRGALAWAHADEVHYPGTYLAGGYDRATTEIEGRDVENEDLANLPNWSAATFRFDGGPWFTLDEVDIVAHRQVLDMGRGVLEITVTCRDDQDRRFTVSEQRRVHMACRHLALQRLVIDVDEAVDDLELRVGLDGRVENSGVERYRRLEGHHVDVVATGGDDDHLWLRARTVSSGLDVVMGARVFVAGLENPAERVDAGPHRVDLSVSGSVPAGGRVEVEKVVAVHTSRDRAGYEPGVDVARSLETAGPHDELVRSHERTWRDLWARSTLSLDADDDWVDMVLTLHLFHLHQSFSDHAVDLDVGVPARGWHGEAYRGHIFWDEMFVLPFLSSRFPDRTRAAIRYRHRRLPEARRAAVDAGQRGAMFPWQSGSTGREESQQWHLNPRSGRWNHDPTHLQRHVGIAIAYDVVQHWRVTADDEFLHDCGAEILLAVADFLAGLARWDGRRQRYVIRGVVGPDEYHTADPDASEPGLSDNAYTNVMTSWLLAEALDVLDRLPARRAVELRQSLDLDEDRLATWRLVSERLFVPFLPPDQVPEGRHVMEQFDGYRDLEEFDWGGYRERYGDLARLDRILEAEGDTPDRYKVSKQADVVMCFYLLTADELVEVFERLGYPFDPDDIPATVDYYEARTSHGSTLSSVVHSWVVARTDRAASWELFREALAADISDIQGGTTPEGIHLGAMAGTLDLAQRVYSGLSFDGDVIRLNPRLPDPVRRLEFSIRFRTHWSVDVAIADGSLVVGCRSPRPEPVVVAVKDERVEIHPGTAHHFDLVRLKGPG